MPNKLPISVMEKLLREAGAKRVSESAKITLLNVLEKKSNELSKKAILFAKHANRKTIKKEDLKLALD